MTKKETEEITTNAQTEYINGCVNDLAQGVSVEVHGTTTASSVLLATNITFF